MDDLQSVVTSLYQHATKFYCIVVDLTRFKDNSIPLQRNERNRKAGFMLLLGYVYFQVKQKIFVGKVKLRLCSIVE